MRLEEFPPADRRLVEPMGGGRLVYRCLGCGRTHGIERLLYTCPDCGQVLLIEDQDFDRLRARSGADWRRAFDLRRMVNRPSCKGVFLYHELLAPVVPPECVVYLGEGHTPLVEASPRLRDRIGCAFASKNDGQNPSASFKDRGMAVALSYLRYLIEHRGAGRVLSVCASTGDTSASAALYGAYLAPAVASAVLLPKGKVTPSSSASPWAPGPRSSRSPGCSTTA